MKGTISYLKNSDTDFQMPVDFFKGIFFMSFDKYTDQRLHIDPLVTQLMLTYYSIIIISHPVLDAARR
jgi:hypothetical protein